MGTANDKALSGLCSIQVAADEWHDVIETGTAGQHDVVEAARCLGNLLDSPKDSNAALALACAVLNTRTLKSGWMFSVGPLGTVNVDYFADDRVREVIVGAYLV